MSNELSVASATASSDLPTFHSEEIKQKLTDVRNFIEGFEEQANRVSSDIKSLEVYLKEHALRIPSHCRGDDSWDPYDDMIDPWETSPEGKVVTTTFHLERLLWDADEHGEYRILYSSEEVTVEYRCSEVEGVNSKELMREVLERKPLIETKLEVRLRMFKWLPDLLERVAENTVESVPGAEKLARKARCVIREYPIFDRDADNAAERRLRMLGEPVLEFPAYDNWYDALRRWLRW